MTALSTTKYLTGERAIERLAECAAIALEHHQADDVDRKTALTAALAASRQAVGYAMHAAHLVRKELNECQVPA